MTNSPQPGTYVKDGETRVAHSSAQAVQLVFDGFRRKEGADKSAPSAAPVTDKAPVPTAPPAPRSATPSN